MEKMIRRLMLPFVFLLLVWNLDGQTPIQQWGVSSAGLGNALREAPTMKEMLTSRQVLIFDRFLPSGGEDVEVTPTECRLAWTADTLYLLFRCSEPNMSFLAVSHDEDWYSLISTPVEQDASFPDKVDFFLQTSGSQVAYSQFCTTADGQRFAVKRNDPAEVDGIGGATSRDKYTRLEGFRSTVERGASEWIAFMRIPWVAVGGIPQGTFGILPVRTRWRNSEVSSPVASDFTDRPAVDLFVEVRMGEKAVARSLNGALCRLPSGRLRWQRPAFLTYPDEKRKTEILRLMESSRPTVPSNLNERLSLLQNWTCLMEAEGFNFGNTTGSLPDKEMYPSRFRIDLNGLLSKGNLTEACKLTDDYISRMAEMTRRWFADGSAGNVRSGEWEELTRFDEVMANDTVILINGMAGKHRVTISLSFPEFGGIRLQSGRKGFFSPGKLLAIVRENYGNANEYRFTAGAYRINLSLNPFLLTIGEDGAKMPLRISSGEISFRYGADGRIIASDFRRPIAPDEVIFGFGEKFDRFDQNGNVLTLWGMDDWTGLTVGLQNQSYKPVPVFSSTAGYTDFINSSYRLRADVGRSNPQQLRLTQHGDIFDHYFWLKPETALSSYASLTGKPFLPPKWAFEPWMGRKGSAWMNTPDKDPVAEQKRVMNRFAQLDIPHSAIYAEGIGANLPQLHAFTTPRNIRVLSWYYPAITAKSQQELMPEMAPENLPVLRVDNPENLASRKIDYVDFSHPAAVELSRRWWKLRLDLGVAGSMVDFGDRVPEDVVFHDGRKGDEMHNFYAYDYHRTYHQTFAERRGDDFILFGRSAAPGTQQWTAQFPGDLRSNFKGLQGGLRGLLNLSSCGFPYWGSDLGGFRGWTDPEVYIRWVQFACFSPLMRSHGRLPREPWEYGDKAVSVYSFYAWMRESLLDYLYNAAVQSHSTGVPFVRPLAVAFPDEGREALSVSDQYAFGRDLLVCPVVTDEVTRKVVLPKGKWTGLWDGKVTEGPAVLMADAPLEKIPVYIREGAAIPVRLSSSLRFGDSMTGDLIHSLILTPPDVSQKISLVNLEKEEASVVFDVKGPDSIRVELNNLPELFLLIVYGATAESVKAGNSALPELKPEERESLPPGWYYDREGNRTVIRLPRGKDRSVQISYRFQ